MRDQEDQMDAGRIGRTRGSGHVRIPQRRVNQSLRSGVSPSMNQPTGPQGHFQGAGIQSNYVPMRASKPNYGGAFKRFQQLNRPRISQMLPPNVPQQHPNNGNHFGQLKQGMGGHQPMEGQGPNVRFPLNPPNQQHFPQPNPGPGPIIGQGQQTRNGLLQSLMGDIGQGFNADQFANMQAGTLPGAEQGDFQRAFGIGGGNDNPLKALAQYLTQGQDGSYNLTNPDSTVALQHILMQAIQGQHPNMPGQAHFPMPGGPGGINPGAPMLPGGGGGQMQNPIMALLQQRAGSGRRGQQFIPPMQGYMGA